MNLDKNVKQLPSNPELSLVSAAVEDYFEGMYRGDVARLRHVFHPQAMLYGYRDGIFTVLQIDEWLNKVAKRPIPAQNGEPFEMIIESIDLTGNVGNVKVRDLYMGLRFTDYLNMVKLEGRWQIVNKTFHHD
jgi:hypothetical protein